VEWWLPGAGEGEFFFNWQFLLVVQAVKNLGFNPWIRKIPWRRKDGAQSCLTLCDPVGCSPPGSSVHGIFQVRILEWVAISYSR